jgi:hypothetical protein
LQDTVRFGVWKIHQKTSQSESAKHRYPSGASVSRLAEMDEYTNNSRKFLKKYTDMSQFLSRIESRAKGVPQHNHVG